MTASSAPATREFTPYNVYALTLICGGFFLSYADRQILGVLLTPIKSEFQLSDTVLGLVSGLGFGVFYSLLSLPLARFADHGNRKNLLAVCIGLWSAATALCGTAGSALHLLVARMFVAVGEAGGTPTSISMISDLFSKSRGIAIACYNAAGSLGGAAVAVLGAWVASEYGWRSAFVVVGAPGILLGMLILLTLREPDRGTQGTSMSDAESTRPGSFQSVGMILGNPALVFCILGGAASSAVIAMTTWLPSFLQRSHGLSLAEAGGALGVGMLIAGPFGELAGGLLNDRLGKRSPAAVLQAVAVVSLVTIPVGLAMLLVSSVGMAMTFLVIWRLLATVFVPPTWALSQALVRPDQRATSQALTGMAGNLLGYGCGPAVTGWLSELLRPFYGNDSLRWAIVASLTLFGLAAAVVYARAARNLRRMN